MRIAQITVTFVFSCSVPASAMAGQYHVAPGPDTVVDLAPRDFFKYAPQGNHYDPSSAVGDDYGQHPGVGFPPQDGYFVGVFGGFVNTYRPDGKLYLWETTAGEGLGGEQGPLIQLGLWNWGTATFTPRGDELPASYFGTQFHSQDNPIYEINSSATPLSDFNVTQQYVNAARISFNPSGHNQVTAVASNAVVPEPGMFIIWCMGLAGLAWQEQRRRSAPCRSSK